MVQVLTERQLRFRRALVALDGAQVMRVAPSPCDVPDPKEPWGALEIGFATMAFENLHVRSARGALLRCSHWRLVCDGRQRVNNFEHGLRYGLPSPIDAIGTLRENLLEKRVRKVNVDEEMGDLVFDFEEPVRLVVLNLHQGYESWELVLGDGVGELSNYVLEP